MENTFDRPVIIVAAPRSGSTLLFETLSQCDGIWTIGDESHAVFESIPELQVGNKLNSNRLTEVHATPGIRQQLLANFRLYLENREGSILHPDQSAKHIRLLEKTPKNSLRIPFLEQIFPDALYIYLYRDPRENISSIIEAWRSDRWITYPELPGWNGSWSLLLPPDWQKMHGKTLEQIAAFQWKSANMHILRDLAKVPSERQTTVSYTSLLNDTPLTVKRLCRFMGVDFDAHMESYTRGELPLSRFTQTPPDRNKWKQNEAAINRVMPSIKGIVQRIHKHSIREKDSSDVTTAVAKNAPCPCGSGNKYKRCHGKTA